MAALIVGFLMGIFRLAVDTPVKLLGTTYTQGSFFWIVNNIFFQYYSLLIFIVSIGVMIGVSYMTKEPSYEKLDGLTFSTTSADQRKENRSSWGIKEVVASVILVLAILAIYLYFS